MPAEPLLPGTGEGNSVAWSDLALEDRSGARRMEAGGVGCLMGYLEQHRAALGIDVAELHSRAASTVHDDGALVQIHAPRVIDGVPVRDST